MKEQLKTSEEWYPIIQERWKERDSMMFVIYDPDGWDRRNYQYSWYEELITEAEFEKRILSSTCLIQNLK